MDMPLSPPESGEYAVPSQRGTYTDTTYTKRTMRCLGIMDRELTDKFVGMYVNDWTLDYGERGRAAVRRLLADAHAAGLTPDAGEIEFIG